MKRPAAPLVVRATEGQTTHLMARLVTKDDVAVIQSDITGTSGQEITRKVYDLDSSTPTTATDTDTLDKTAKIFDSLQTSAEWTADSTGYNFLDSVATAKLPTSGPWRVVYSMVVTGEETLTWDYLVDMSDVYGS